MPDRSMPPSFALSGDTTSPPPTPRRERTRRRLIAAAAEVFVEHGVQSASVEEICRHAGFTRGAFYSNFATKEQLFLAVLADQYAQRAERLARGAEVIAPLLAGEGHLTQEQAAAVIDEHFAPTGSEPTWFALETEFVLLAMRDPRIAAEVVAFMTRARAELTGLVEPLLAAAGRTFTLPADHAVAALGGVYERALTITALTGREAPEGLDEFGSRLAELLFAITEPIDAADCGTPGSPPGGRA